VLWTSLLPPPTGPGVLADAGGPLWLLPNINVGPDLFIIRIGSLSIVLSNTLFMAWVSIAIVLFLFIGATRKMAIIPRGLQNFVELATETFLNFCKGIAGEEKGRRFFPFVATIFFYVLFANWASILPGVESIGTPDPAVGQVLHPFLGIFLVGADSNKIIPWIRPASTDLNFTLALALISVVMTQIYSFRALGVGGQLGKYIVNPLRNPLGFFIGALEIVSEFARVISFSFRLFGNVFAGDVLLLVLGTLLPFVGATIFYPLELFVGFIQAFVFAVLTLVFLSLGTTKHGAEEAAAHEHI